MGGNDEDDRRKHSNFVGNIADVEKEEEDEEALSLCDLPISQENNHLSRNEAPPKAILDSQEEFNFCFSLADSTSKESEMCAADEVFFQGQILPLRHSISSESGLTLATKLHSDNCPTSRCISRSESMDHSYSVGFTSASSRSSSINSHHSSSSGTSSATPGTPGTSKRKPRPKISNNFQYSHHPSPKPQIRSSNIKNGITNTNSNRKSTVWSIFRVGLVTTPEIAIQDLKIRTNSKKTSGSRNSTSTLSNSCSGRIKAEKEQKTKQKFFDKNGAFFSSCKCSSNAVAGPIPSWVAENVIRRSASANDSHAKNEEQEEKEKERRTTKQRQQQAGKQALSRHRTFEWLKQLSLEAAAVIDEA